MAIFGIEIHPFNLLVGALLLGFFERVTKPAAMTLVDLVTLIVLIPSFSSLFQLIDPLMPEKIATMTAVEMEQWIVESLAQVTTDSTWLTKPRRFKSAVRVINKRYSPISNAAAIAK